MIIDDRDSLRITRMFSAMRERVYQAWTDADEIRRWWHAGEGFAPSLAEIHAAEGGRFRLGMISSANGKEDIATGTYREVSPADRLKFTWRFEDNPTAPESLVTVEFADHGKNTEVLLVHEGLPSQEENERMCHFWNACLAQLAVFLHEAESPPIELCVTVQVSEDKVFQALTDATQLTRWFPTSVENDPVAGGQFAYTWEYADDPSRNHMRCGSYTEVIPNKTVCHTWDARPMPQQENGRSSADEARPTLVEFRLAPDTTGGTRVMLVHSGWGSGSEWNELREGHSRGWTFFLANLKSYLESGTDERSKELGMRCAETVQGIGY